MDGAQVSGCDTKRNEKTKHSSDCNRIYGSEAVRDLALLVAHKRGHRVPDDVAKIPYRPY